MISQPHLSRPILSILARAALIVALSTPPHSKAQTGPVLMAFDSARVGTGHQGGISSVAFSPNGLTLASGGKDGAVRLWEAGTLTPRGVNEKLGNTVTALAYSPDGRRLYVGTYGRIIALDPARPTRQIVRRSRAHTSFIEGMAISADGRQMVTSSWKDASLRLWTLPRIDPGPALAEDVWTDAVALSPDGRLMASGGHHNRVRMWQTGTGLQSAEMLAHTDWVYGLAFLAGGAELASAALDGRVVIQETTTGRILRQWQAHKEGVTFLAASPDGQRFATASLDSSVRLWDVATGRLLAHYGAHGSRVEALAFSPDGRVIASGGPEGRLHLLFYDPRRQSGR